LTPIIGFLVFLFLRIIRAASIVSTWVRLAAILAFLVKFPVYTAHIWLLIFLKNNKNDVNNVYVFKKKAVLVVIILTRIGYENMCNIPLYSNEYISA
jgi:hypothetical protein